MRKLREMLKKALETGNSLFKGPLWGTWRGFVFREFERERERGGLETEYLLLI